MIALISINFNDHETSHKIQSGLTFQGQFKKKVKKMYVSTMHVSHVYIVTYSLIALLYIIISQPCPLL